MQVLLLLILKVHLKSGTFYLSMVVIVLLLLLLKYIYLDICTFT